MSFKPEKERYGGYVGHVARGAGMGFLGGCKGLADLHLEHTKVTDAGLAHLEGWVGLA